MWDTLEHISNINRVNVNKNERLYSLIAGGFLLLYALIRIPFTAVLALGAALYLFFRSIRGFCYIYDQLGLDTATQLTQVKVSPQAQTAVTEASLLREPN